jgi:hypothetical protein
VRRHASSSRLSPETRVAASLSIASLLAPADGARRRLLRALGPRIGTLAANREARVCLMAIVAVLGALASTALVPLWTLALGPIVLGVPHIVSDVRYLVVRRGYHRRIEVWILAAAPLAVGAVTGRVTWGFLGAIGALAVARATPRRRAIGLVVAVPLALFTWRFPGWSNLGFAHLHNFIGVALWWAWRPRKTRLHWIPIALFAALSTALLLGAADPVLRWSASTGPAGATTLASHMAALAPFAGPTLGARLVLLYAFAQSVHYGVWLRLVPEEDRPRPAPRGFASSYAALRADFGVVPLVVFGALAVALAAWATHDLAGARAGYLRFAVVHGQLELAAAALLWAEARGR